jgi:aryl-alcohol dehydrogenase-like predicted oxidoreductase
VTALPSVPLGRTGLPVTRLALGTATFGAQCDEQASRAILDRADDLGITLLDTADKYPIGSTWEAAGVTESMLGRLLKGRRERFVVATKVHGPTGPRPFDQGLSRRHVLSAVDDSLRRLQSDWIDLYQLHRPDPATPIEETLSALDDLVHAGKVRYVGCSNFLAYQVARALGRSETHGWVRLASVQPRYNLLFRQPERELLPLCREEGLGVLVYNALAGGLLSGKHRPDESSVAGTRFADPGVADLYRTRYWTEEAFAAVEGIRRVATAAGVGMPALATAWLLAQPGVTSVVLGATKVQHLELAAAALAVQPTDDLLAALGEVTAVFRSGDAVQ